MKGWPVRFHDTHSENIELTPDRRRAKRIESFCKGICFSSRPIGTNERVYIRFAETSTSWSGVIRFGFTCNDPVTINGAELPRYACPDLTNKPGFWAKALPERSSEKGVILFFYVTRSGDVMYGINGEEKGVFFSGIDVNNHLWAIVDIYGNTTAMEFVDGRQLNNLSPSGSSHGDMILQQELAQQVAGMSLNAGSPKRLQSHRGSMPALTHSSEPTLTALSTGMPVRYHANCTFSPVPFHERAGRNVCLNTDRTIVVRQIEEYCNGYVFTSRPLRIGEKLVIQILAVDKAYTGGLAFGMTACEPIDLSPNDLPDDSDMLLDRPEYWVVNKDVCSAPEVGDELSFYMSEEGEIRYGKNGYNVATLMFIDKTLPLWAFFDVYGSSQKIKSLGIVTGTVGSPGVSTRRASVQSVGAGGGGGLTVALPPPRSPASPNQMRSPVSSTPPRPPPPRQSTSPSRGAASRGVVPPVLPPKQYQIRNLPPPHAPLPAQPPLPGTMLVPTPAPGFQTTSRPRRTSPSVDSKANVTSTPKTTTPAAVPSATAGATPTHVQTEASKEGPRPTHRPQDTTDESEEAADNAMNECSVCFEKAVDCVLYTCGHMCVCYECAVDIQENQAALCPICRQEIKDIIKIYRS